MVEVKVCKKDADAAFVRRSPPSRWDIADPSFDHAVDGNASSPTSDRLDLVRPTACSGTIWSN
ncbi:hypothetical protein Tdes44962_MAKER07286 [Teratosphaeria destructans]|uniref:Uncharacterized protein n=1 Tax=Teratosphaeria destructans TaxID=418781 RepID=A0A9W7SZA3_9PEZI|nr:hypothetical protein Tdes44962_MAKER07286 [Teratosphaeria destructans]